MSATEPEECPGISLSGAAADRLQSQAMKPLRWNGSALFLLFALAAAGCGDRSSSGAAFASAAAPPNATTSAAGPAKVTSEKEVCRAVEGTYHVLRDTLDTAIGGRFPPYSVEKAVKIAEKLERGAESWRAKRGSFDAKSAAIGDRFADAMIAHAKLLRSAKAAKPRPDDTPTALPANATAEERRKAALQEAARFGLKGLVNDGPPPVEVDRTAWEESFTKLHDIWSDYLDACLTLMDENDVAPAPSGDPTGNPGAPPSTTSR